jgi:RimJ/RimL family protein N-acetyltransferase
MKSGLRRARGPRLVPLDRRYVRDLVDGFNSGIASETTLWRLPTAYPTNGVPTLTRIKRRKSYRFAILDETKRFVGMCSLFDGTYGGYTLAIAIFDPQARGRGIGTFAMRALCDFGFRTLRTHRIELGVYPSNHRAIAVYEKVGFKREAVLRRDIYHDGEWQNSYWMSLLRDEWKKNIASPRS